MASILGLSDASDLNAIRASIADGLTNLISEVSVELSPNYASIIATYSASILLAASGTTLVGRKQLLVMNTDKQVAVRVGPSSVNAIYEDGIVIEPGQTMVFSFTGASDVDLYVRSAGYAVRVEVMEA